METLDINQLSKILPQKYPFLMVDQVIELISGEKASAIKNVTINEPYFIGHFPGNPIMPGALILEAMAQTAIVLYWSKYKDQLSGNPEYYLGAIKEVSFKRKVLPGDQLRMEAVTVRILLTQAFITVKSYVGDSLAAEAEFIFGIKP
jgi:3-hydroxyacyl-[acyl-carrier-protein] dehydratase